MLKPSDTASHGAELSAPDRALIAREARLPGVATLLDADRCRTWLQRVIPHLEVEDLRPEYLRYKPATSCLAGFALRGPSAPPYVYLKAFNADKPEKFRKIRAKSEEGRGDKPICVDPALGIAAWFFPQDDVLESLAGVISDPSRYLAEWSADLPASGLQLNMLRYKPERRFVGQLCHNGPPVAAIKLYTDRDYERARQNAKVLGSLSAPRAPQRIGHSHRHAGLLFEWLQGARLSDLLGDDEGIHDAVEHVGAALAELHLQWCHKLHRASTSQFAQATAAAEAIAMVLPHLADRAKRLTNRLFGQLADAAAMTAVCHGDFYADQVVVGRTVAVVDLDNAGPGDPAEDMGNFFAHVERAALLGLLEEKAPDRIRHDLLAGYSRIQPAPPQRRIRAHAAASLLRLAIEPFRKRQQNWAENVETVLGRAETLGEPIRAARSTRPNSESGSERPAVVDDPSGAGQDGELPFVRHALTPALVLETLPAVLRPALGAAAVVDSIRVLRHKPGRRCLIEYSLGGLAAGSQSCVVLGKCTRRAVARRDFQTQQRLYNAGFHSQAADGICVPQPLAVHEPWNIWFQQRVSGQAASVLLTHPDAISFAERAAEALYKIHRLGPQPSRVHTISDELEILHTRLLTLAATKPEWRGRLQRLLAGCEDMAANVPIVMPRPIHRDYYPDQVLIDGPRTTVCDFDLYCLGDPAIDVGNYAAHILEQSLRELGSLEVLKPIHNAFVSRYLALNRDVAPAAVEAFTTLTLVRHISISASMESRRAYTPDLLQLCDERLASF